VKRTKEEAMIGTDSTRRLGTALGVGVLLSAALEAIYYYGGVAGTADSTPLRAALVGAAGAVVAGVVAWLAVRGVYADAGGDRLARRTVALGAGAVISLAGFWIGVTVPICVAAVALGRRTAVAGRPLRGHLTAGVAAIVFAATIVLCVLGAS
jgi:hypothetical protein